MANMTPTEEDLLVGAAIFKCELNFYLNLAVVCFLKEISHGESVRRVKLNADFRSESKIDKLPDRFVITIDRNPSLHALYLSRDRYGPRLKKTFDIPASKISGTNIDAMCSELYQTHAFFSFANPICAYCRDRIMDAPSSRPDFYDKIQVMTSDRVRSFMGYSYGKPDYVVFESYGDIFLGETEKTFMMIKALKKLSEDIKTGRVYKKPKGTSIGKYADLVTYLEIPEPVTPKIFDRCVVTSMNDFFNLVVFTDIVKNFFHEYLLKIWKDYSVLYAEKYSIEQQKKSYKMGIGLAI